MRSVRARRVALVRKIDGLDANRWRGVSSCARQCSLSVGVVRDGMKGSAWDGKELTEEEG